MSGCSALVQQCNQVGVANCVACSLPDKTLIIPPAAVIPMPGSLSFKLTIKKKLHLGLPRPALASSVFALVERLSMAITIWRLVTTAAFIASRSTLRFKWTASARFRVSSLHFPLLSCCHCCCSCQLYSHVVVSLELQHGSFHLPICMQAMITASATLPRALSVPCPVLNPSLQLSLFMWPETRLCLSCLALPDWRRSAVGVCSLCACFIIMPSSYAQRSHYLPHTLYTMYTIHMNTYTFMYSSSPLCIPPLSPAFSHAIVVSLAINLSLRIIKFVCSSNYAP